MESRFRIRMRLAYLYIGVISAIKGVGAEPLVEWFKRSNQDKSSPPDSQTTIIPE
jgi:hypothetical protein